MQTPDEKVIAEIGGGSHRIHSRMKLILCTRRFADEMGWKIISSEKNK